MGSLSLNEELYCKIRVIETFVSIETQNVPEIKLSIRPSRSDRTPMAFVFLGENDFSYSTAFAARRGSWQGVVPTYYEEETDKLPAENFALEAQKAKETLKNCYNASEPHLLNEMESFEWNVIQFTPPARRHLDATDMGTRDELKKNMGIADGLKITFWLQCPWSYDIEPMDQREKQYFLAHLILSAAKVQLEGEYLLIGFCVCQLHTVWKRLAEVFYKCIGADQTFVGEMLARGYQHQNHLGNDSPLESKEQLTTILFQRNGEKLQQPQQPEQPLHPEQPIHRPDIEPEAAMTSLSLGAGVNEELNPV